MCNRSQSFISWYYVKLIFVLFVSVRLHEADRAISHLNTGQIDGNVIRVEALEGLC